MHEHLGNWVPGFVAKALTIADTDFYRGHLMMLRGFLSAEEERLQVILEDLSDKNRVNALTRYIHACLYTCIHTSYLLLHLSFITMRTNFKLPALGQSVFFRRHRPGSGSGSRASLL